MKSILLVSLFILFYGYNTSIDDLEISYNENMRKSIEERKVFKKLFEQGWAEHDTRIKFRSTSKNDRINSNKPNSVHQWPNDIVIIDSSLIAKPNENTKSPVGVKKGIDKREMLRKWVETMSNLETDVNGKQNGSQ